MKITKDMNIGQVVATNMELIPLLQRAGMHCFGCPMAQMENLEDAAAGHGIDVDKLVAALNNKLEELEAQKAE